MNRPQPRHGLGTRRDRLAVLEQQRADQIRLLTERTRRQVSRHVAADRPRDLCSLDTFYIGTLKGAAHGLRCGVVVRLSPGRGWRVTAAAMAAFLLEVVRPGYRAAGWRLRRVLTDNGKEFSGAFSAACAAQQIRHTRTTPRHAWTNGFVERVPGTMLHEHWRVAFRRQHFTRLRQLQQSLDRFLHFYKTQRPHQGSRLRGQTPVTVFAGAAAP